MACDRKVPSWPIDNTWSARGSGISHPDAQTPEHQDLNRGMAGVAAPTFPARQIGRFAIYMTAAYVHNVFVNRNMLSATHTFSILVQFQWLWLR